MNSIIVLHGPRTGHARPDASAAALAQLAYAKRLELEARSAEDRAASLAGIALAHAALHALTGRTHAIGEFVFPRDGKPMVRGAASFSISHSARWIGSAVASHDEIGFDIEELDPLRSPIEIERWTGIEATLKAAGAGIRSARAVDLDLDRLRSRLGECEYVLSPVDLGDERRAFIASAKPAGSIEVRSIDPEDCLVSLALLRAARTHTMPAPSAAATAASSFA